MHQQSRWLLHLAILPLLTTGSAVLITRNLPALQHWTPLFLSITAVILCTRIGGWPAGLIATLCAAVGTTCFIFSPVGSIKIADPQNVFRLMTFLFIASMIVWMHASLARSQANHRHSEQRLMLSLDSAHMGVWDYNLISRKFFRSPTLEEIYGRCGDRFADTYGQFFGYMHFDDQPLFNRAITRTIDEGTDYEIDHRILLPDQSIRWINTRGRVFFNPAGRAERIVGVVTDITAKKSMLLQPNTAEPSIEDQSLTSVA